MALAICRRQAATASSVVMIARSRLGKRRARRDRGCDGRTGSATDSRAGQKAHRRLQARVRDRTRKAHSLVSSHGAVPGLTLSMVAAMPPLRPIRVAPLGSGLRFCSFETHPVGPADRAVAARCTSRAGWHYAIEISTASAPRLSISPSRRALSRMITPASFCSQRSPALVVPTAMPYRPCA